MKINIITNSPLFYSHILKYHIVSRAIYRGILELKIIDYYDYSKQIDDESYGVENTMVIKADVVNSICENLQSDGYYVASPSGKLIENFDLKNVLVKKNITIFAGYYGGIDRRALNKNNILEFSIGNYILSNGDYPIMIFLDMLVRYMPGALKDASLKSDYVRHGLCHYDIYTRPLSWHGFKIPSFLASGHHAMISRIVLLRNIVFTKLVRPDLYRYFMKLNVGLDFDILLKKYDLN